jgi:hypothetical protein
MPMSSDLARSSNSAVSQAPLLATKLYVPQLRTDAVPRPRLIELLSHGIKQTLTLASDTPPKSSA